MSDHEVDEVPIDEEQCDREDVPAALTSSNEASAENDDEQRVAEPPTLQHGDLGELPPVFVPPAIPVVRPPMISSASIASNVAVGANALAQALGDLARLAMPTTQDLLDQQPELRHTHSTPLQIRRSTLYTSDEEDIPPPVPLDPFQRSSSTPSSFRQRSINSAFGAVNQSSHLHHDNQYAASGSAFDVVRYYASGIDDMERTSIEVTDSTLPNNSSSAKPEMIATTNRKPAFRAKKYLSRFPVLNRKLKNKIGGRENPAQPASVGSSESKSNSDSSSSKETSVKETTVTVVTENNNQDVSSVNDTSVLSTSSEVSAIVRAGGGNTDSSQESKSEAVEEPKKDESEFISETPSLIPADDEAASLIPADEEAADLIPTDEEPGVEEEIVYQKIETQLHGDSPTPIDSPIYQKMESPVSQAESPETKPRTRKIRIQVSDVDKSSSSGDNVASPIPSARIGSLESAEESPGTKSSNTGSSVLASNAVSLSSGSLLQSGLSTISETDREVMEANKEGKRRRFMMTDTGAPKKTENDGASIHSSSTTTTNSSANPHAYLSLGGGSPASLREGAAVVPGERTISLGSSRRSGSSRSPAGTSSLSLTNTSSSGSSRAEPPTFVSYREDDTTSERKVGGPSETRDVSPAELGAMRFEAAASPTVNSQRTNLLERSRSRPPLSPIKGSKSSQTPPPHSSVSPAYQQLSPPRNLVGQYVLEDTNESKISRPFVVRSTPGGIQQGEDGNLSAPTGPDGRMYSEKSIEILQTDSKNEPSSANLVTPEKQEG